MATQTTDDRRLPYSKGSVTDMRAHILRDAYEAEQRFGALTDRLMHHDMTDAEQVEHRIACFAMMYGYTTASLLGFIRDKFGPEAEHQAACMVDEMGTNGGAPYNEGFAYPPADAPAEG